MDFVNLTPHAIVVLNECGESHTFEPSGSIARVSSTPERLESIGGFSVTCNNYGQVENLPSQDMDTIYVVSGLVLAHCGHRGDVVAPRTDSSAVRNEKGHIIAVRGFVAPTR